MLEPPQATPQMTCETSALVLGVIGGLKDLNEYLRMGTLQRNTRLEAVSFTVDDLRCCCTVDPHGPSL